MVILDSATAKIFRGTISQLQRDVHREWHNDVFEVFRVKRPASGWDSGSTTEGLTLEYSGVGKLYANGAGGPIASEDVIFPESPYRLRTVASILDGFRVDGMSTPDLSGCQVVVNGSRLFVIDSIKPEDVDDYLVDIYLTELIGKPLPVISP